jgi:hypothetical protein
MILVRHRTSFHVPIKHPLLEYVFPRDCVGPRKCLSPLISGEGASREVPVPFALQTRFGEQAPRLWCTKIKTMRRNEREAVLQSRHREDQA